jgi:hypothetical protein
MRHNESSAIWNHLSVRLKQPDIHLPRQPPTPSGRNTGYYGFSKTNRHHTPCDIWVTTEFRPPNFIAQNYSRLLLERITT